jgi:basic membrane lipoprotein Med (substrate-binding protein (PBP1-ABC) superfamily)
MPVYGTVACINAFAIGAAMTDPKVKIQLDWETKQDTNWWWDMVNDGIHVVSAVDSLHNKDGSDAYGVCHVERCEPGQGNDLSGTCLITHLAAPVYKWGKLYEIIVRTIIEGTYSSSAVDKKDRATNYWWGMISGVVDIELSDAISPYTKKLVEILRRDITEANFNPFDGELRSQEGVIRRADEAPLTSMEVITMDWLNENVIGEIPKMDTLVDEAKATVKYSGVEKSKTGVR